MRSTPTQFVPNHTPWPISISRVSVSGGAPSWVCVWPRPKVVCLLGTKWWEERHLFAKLKSVVRIWYIRPAVWLWWIWIWIWSESEYPSDSDQWRQGCGSAEKEAQRRTLSSQSCWSILIIVLIAIMFITLLIKILVFILITWSCLLKVSRCHYHQPCPPSRPWLSSYKHNTSSLLPSFKVTITVWLLLTTNHEKCAFSIGLDILLCFT